MELRVYCPDPNYVPRKKPGRHLPKALTEEQEEAYVQAARVQLEAAIVGRPARKYRPKPPPCKAKIKAAERDLFMVQFVLGTGLRAEEFRLLRLEHISLTAPSVFVDRGKGDKQRYVPLPDVLVSVVRDWIGERKDGYLMPIRNQPMSDATFYYRIRRLGRRAGIPFVVHPHTLRHTMATRVYEVTRDLNVVKELLGHESISTTQIYARCAPGLQREAVNLRYKPRPDVPPKGA